MGGIPKDNFGSLVGSCDDMEAEEYSFEFGDSGSTQFSFEMPDVRMNSQLKEELKEAKKDLAVAKKEIALYKKILKDLRDEREMEYNCRRTAKNKCFWLKQMYIGLVEFLSDLGTYLEAERRGKGGGFLKGGHLKMLKRIPARLKPLIERLEDAKKKEDFGGFDEALDKVMKSCRLLQSRLRGDGDAESYGAEDNGRTVGGGKIPIELAEHTAAVIPLLNEQEKDPNGGGVAIKTVDGGQEVVPLKTRHAVKRKNSRECLCGFTSMPTNVRIHVTRLTKGRKTLKGSFVCPICGDKLMAKPSLRAHLACHKSPKPVSRARIQSDGSSEDVQNVEAIKSSGGQRTSKQAPKSRTGLTSSSSSSSGLQAKTPELPLIEISENGQTKVACRKSLRSATSNGKHHICPENPRQCSCGFVSRNVRNHIWRVTTGRNATHGSYVCEHCGDRFRESGILKKHLTCHGPPPNATLGDAPPSKVQTEAKDVVDDGMPILTQQCLSPAVSTMPDTTTDVQDAISEPMRSQTENVETKCSSCGKHFPLRCHLWKHCFLDHNVKLPTSGPPFSCRLCDETFDDYHQYFDHQFAMHP